MGSAIESAATSRWRPIPIGDYFVPAQDARAGLAGAWRRLWDHGKEEAAGESVDPEPFGSERIEALVPALDLEAGAQYLARDLESWLGRAAGAPRSVLLAGPPGSGVQEVFDLWARRAQLTRVETPRREEIESRTWEPVLPEDTTLPLVLPPLERTFLRRRGGLDRLRVFFERLQRERRCFVAASDGWSWSFLRRTLPVSGGFDRVLAPAAHDAAALRDWFASLDPELELLGERGQESVLADGDALHPWLRALAGAARGNPGVACALWRRALCDAHLSSRPDGVQRCRLPAWRDLTLPSVPRRLGKSGALLLHALLVHAGLDARSLASVLPLEAAHVQALLWDLAGQGVVVESDGRWRVSLAGVPSVRTHLSSLNLPLDDF